MLFYTALASARSVDWCHARGFGILATGAAIAANRPGMRRAVELGTPLALDNDMWSTQGDVSKWDAAQFRATLQEFGHLAEWVVVPDIVYGGLPSLAFSIEWLPFCLQHCRRALIAVQDGMTPADVLPYLPDRVGVFVGGTTEFKLSTAAEWAALGVYCHVGRVNTARRIRFCQGIGAASCDGSGAVKFQKSQGRIISGAINQGSFVF